SAELHQAFLKAGLYRTLQPRMFGGYEFSIDTFYRAMLEISWGDPGIGWCLTLCASHPFLVASHWSEEAQRDFFSPDGFYASPHSSHFVGAAIVPDGQMPPTVVNVVVPKDKITILPDWGGDKTLGMRASGS